MTPTEVRAAVSLAGIFFLRMFGLFAILPVFSLYTGHMPGATPFLIGIALGAYGLTQALLQIPFGMLSDRFGRKPVITAGLLIFAAGSVIAAVSDDIYLVILGRGLQGAGAIAAAVMALAADLTREAHRTKAMALIGISIGFAFSFAFILGPVVAAWVGLAGLFWMAFVLALAAIGILYLAVPTPAQTSGPQTYRSDRASVVDVLKDPRLLRLDVGIFLLHLILTASFVAIPLALRDSAGLDAAAHWKIYLPVLVVSVLFMLPLIYWAERKGKFKQVFTGAILGLGIAELGLGLSHHALGAIVLFLLLFFTTFNYLEATLPSLVSKTAPAVQKGAALGVYSTAQFIGTFVGGAGGGFILGHSGLGGVFLLGAMAAALWSGVAFTMAGSPARQRRTIGGEEPAND